MIKIEDKTQCCGCTACMEICPKEAISMKPDGMGFLYPVVNSALCIDCCLCEKVCPFNDKYDRTAFPEMQISYAARNKDVKEVSKSQSGAAFYTLARRIIQDKGVVYGAVFKNIYEIVHDRATTLDGLDELRGSKYVQSNLHNTFSLVLSDLKQGQTVLFSGTGCQCAGLQSLVKLKHLDDSNLFLCDIVCHGVSSPFVWRDNVKYIEKKYKSKVLKANFRNKELFGWHDSVSSYNLQNGRTITSNDYNKAFGSCYINRRSCDICYFANLNRSSDITIGDFWGLKKLRPDWDAENKGVSLIIINSSKGEFLFNLSKNEFEYFECKIDDCLQPNLLWPSKPSHVRDSFERVFVEKGYEAAMKKYGEFTIQKEMRKKYLSLRHKAKLLIQSIIGGGKFEVVIEFNNLQPQYGCQNCLAA